MANIAKFKRTDGVEFECEVGSASFELMQKEGAFMLTSIDDERQPISAIEPETAPDPNAVPVPVDRSKMTKAELVAEAESLEIDTVPDKATKQQIIEMIEAKLAGADEEDGASE